MLTKDDLTGLGISPGPLFAQIFKAIKPCKTKEEALSVAVAVRDGTFERKKREVSEIPADSVLAWAVENRHWFPVLEQTTGCENSVSAIRRMFEQRTITLNGRKPEPADKMEFPIWELCFFKGSQRQHTIFWNLDLVPKGATWMNFIWEKEKNARGGPDFTVVVGTEWRTKE